MSDAAVDARTTIQTQLPCTTRLRHYLTYYNPIVWWRATVMRKKIVNWYTYDMILLCLFPTTCRSTIPLLTRWRMIPQRPHSSPTTTTTSSLECTHRPWLLWPTLMAPAVVVPLYAYLLVKIGRTVQSIRTSIRELQQSRMMAHAEAYQCLYERMMMPLDEQEESQHGRRAYRTHAYDVYLPPSHSLESTESNDHHDQLPTFEFILFLPGALVEHVAYSQPAAMLSDHGYVVIVMSSEPLGIVDMQIPQFYVSHIQQIQQDIETKHAKRSTITAEDNNNNNNNNHSQCRWIFMGHSMGSLTCTKLIPYFPNIKEIVLWGSAPFLDYMGHIAHMDQDLLLLLRVLVVQGTKDEIIQCYCTPEMVQEYWNRLPPSTTTLHEIIGGTHHGFGNYIRNNNNEKEDRDIIPIYTQHEIAVQVTIDFLRGRNH